MQITGTHFNYYQICKRKLWLFAQGIQMEHNSDLVYEGKLIHENTYPQRNQGYEELEVDGIKIDFYDSKNKIIHEIKKSNKVEDAHILQLEYYLFVLERNGLSDVTGILEYPLIRKTKQVVLCDSERERIRRIEADIIDIINEPVCLPVIKNRICDHCSYYEFCYCGEEENS